MKIQALKLAYFSPTGTTKSIVQAIANGIKQFNVQQFDVTSPDARKIGLQTFENDLLVVAVPVYLGRVPALLAEWLYAIKANKTPVVCVVVYGNRGYGDALLEIKNTLTKVGAIPIACAAYIGEHSFSSFQTPIARSRPDANDLYHAVLFGRKITEKLESISLNDQISDIDVPGSYPYKGDTKIWNVDFIAVNNECTQCRICAQGCPVGAIDPEHSNKIDIEKCITCCACIKNCPQHARKMKPGSVKDAAIRLNQLYPERREPIYFI